MTFSSDLALALWDQSLLLSSPSSDSKLCMYHICTVCTSNKKDLSDVSMSMFV